jgi:predicted secreted protein
MATTGTINATLLAIWVGAVKMDVQLNCDLSISHDPRVSINKDSAGWEGTRSGKKSWEMSGESEMQYDATQGMEELFDALIAGTELTLQFSTEVTGDVRLSGVAQVTKLDISAGVEEDVNFSYAFKGNGAIAKTTVS